MAASESSILKVQQMYVAYYGRPGDPAGVDYWASVLDVAESTGGSLDVNQFGESQEFLDGIGGPDNSTADQVTILFQQMFNRDPDPEGLAFWVNAIDTGIVTLAQSALAIAEGVQNEDAIILANKVAGAVYYTEQVTETGVSYTSDDIASAQAIIATIDETARSVIDSYLLTDDALDLVDQGDTDGGDIFTLTTGQDVITGTLGDDKIAGVFSTGASDASSFTIGDTIDGRDGDDTLELYVNDDGNALSFVDKSITNVETVMIYTTDGGWNGLNLANTVIDDLILDSSLSTTLETGADESETGGDEEPAGGEEPTGGDEDTGVSVDGVLASTAVTVQQIGDNADAKIDLNFSDDSRADADITVTLQDMNTNKANISIAEVNQTNAATSTLNLNVSNVDSNEVFNVDAGIQTDAATSTLNLNVSNVDSNEAFNVGTGINAKNGADVALAVNADVNNVVGKDVNFDLDFRTNGVTATAAIDIADSNVHNFTLDIDNDHMGTSDIDVVTLNLDGMNNGVSDNKANFSLDSFETININVTKDAVFNRLTTYDLEGNDQAINIDVASGATLSFQSEFEMDSTWTKMSGAGNQTLTITGAGNVLFTGLGLEMNWDASTAQIVDASAMTGDLTLVDGMYGRGDNRAGIDVLTSGSGNDTLFLGGYTTTVVTNAGNDFVDVIGLDYGDDNASTIDGGDGTDTIAINNGAHLNEATAENISNFEILDVRSGTGDYDMKLESSLAGVSITDTKIRDNINIQNVAAGTTLDYSVTGASDVDLMGSKSLTFNLEDSSATSDELDITLSANDTDTDQTAEAEITASVIAAGIENVNIDSSATTKSQESSLGAGDALTSADYTNNFDLFAEDAVNIVITGDAMLKLAVGDVDSNARVEYIDATGNSAGVLIDVSAVDASNAVTFNGSDADDKYSATQNGDVIQANAGADTINLATTTVVDAETGTTTVSTTAEERVRYVSADDSRLVLTDDDDDDDADSMSGFDTVNDFGTEDIIELSSALNLPTGDARADILKKGTLEVGESVADELEDLIGDGVDFFDSGLVDRATAFAVDSTGDGWLFIDSSGDGDFSYADDMVIQLAGVNTLATTDIIFG